MAVLKENVCKKSNYKVITVKNNFVKTFYGQRQWNKPVKDVVRIFFFKSIEFDCFVLF